MAPPKVINVSGNGSSVPTNSISTSLNCTGANNGSIYVLVYSQDYIPNTTILSDPTNGVYTCIDNSNNGDISFYYVDGVFPGSYTITCTHTGSPRYTAMSAVWITGIVSSPSYVTLPPSDDQNKGFFPPSATLTAKILADADQLLLLGAFARQETSNGFPTFSNNTGIIYTVSSGNTYESGGCYSITTTLASRTGPADDISINAWGITWAGRMDIANYLPNFRASVTALVCR